MSVRSPTFSPTRNRRRGHPRDANAVSLAAPDENRAGKESSFTLTGNEEQLTDLEPYLGAAAHVAIASADTQEFAHTREEARGAAQGTEGPAHEGHEGTVSAGLGGTAPGPENEFQHTFPSPGLYRGSR
ncbi:MAG: hypothetical protein M3N18_01865 [Actinomycetota bacterium]|nr:hypothetical protein [Actinomycetota bacterium]